MNALPAHITKWIKDAYSYHSIVHASLSEVLAKFPTLTVGVEKFVENDGTEKDLLKLKGVIDIKFKGLRYPIFIEVSLPVQYPVMAPVMFVVPAAGTVIEPSELVDRNGAVNTTRLGFHPSKNTNFHALGDALTRAQALFSAYPPVYSQPTGTRPATTTAATTTTNNSHQHHYHHSGHNGHAAHPAAVTAGGFGAYPQRPIAQPTATATATTNGRVGVVSPRVVDRAEASRQALELKLHQYFEQYRSEIAGSASTMDRLATHSQGLDEVVQTLTGAHMQLQGNITTLREATESIKQSVKEQESKVVDVDVVVEARTARDTQQIALVAEDQAIDEAYLALDGALADHVVDLTQYLKSVRALARRQCLARELLKLLIS